MNNTDNIRNIINLLEGRRPDVQYTENDKEVIAILLSYDSQIFTKLAKQFEEIDARTEELKRLNLEFKQQTRDAINDLFDAEDEIKVRIIETKSFSLTMGKMPKATETPKYKDILNELANHLTPELIQVLEKLKEQMVTVTQKEPSVRIKPISEGFVGSLFARMKNAVLQWGQRYDQKLDRLKQMAYGK